MGQGSPVCQQIREKIIEVFKNNVPQRKIGRDLDISPSTVHNIIKRFKESGGISVRKGQGRKPKLNNRDLRSLRRHCIKNRHSSISDITTWAQDYFGKPLSSKKRIIQTVTNNKSKSQGLSWYGVVSVTLAKVTCTSVMAPLMLKST